MDESYVRICPRCQSTSVTPNVMLEQIALGTFHSEYVCDECGYSGMFFPEVQQLQLKK